MDLPVKTVYYDSFDDDFAGTNIKTKTVPADFPFARCSLFWRITSGIAYHLIARPLVWIYSKTALGMKIKGRKNLRGLRGGYFLYGNHTNLLDAFIPASVARWRRAYIVAGPDTVSLRGLRTFVQMIGAIPLPSDVRGMINFKFAISRRFREGGCIAIFPESHIWPYCAKIREFPATSFLYPVQNGAPVVAMVTTYRKRKGPAALIFKKPAMTVTLSGPMYPDPSLTRREAAEKLRDWTFKFMDATSRAAHGVEYIRYVKR